jgi:hypothetical protein
MSQRGFIRKLWREIHHLQDLIGRTLMANNIQDTKDYARHCDLSQ